MKKKDPFFSPFLFLILFIFGTYVIQNFSLYTKKYYKPVLTSPFDLLILPIKIDIPEKLNYFETHSNWNCSKENSSCFQLKSKKKSLEPLYAITPSLATIFIYLLTSLFLFLFAEIKKLEKAYIIFSFNLIIWYLLFLDYITFHQLTLFFYISSITFVIPYLYLFRSIFHKRNSKKLYFSIISIAVLLTILLYPESHIKESLLLKINGIIIFSIIAYSLLLLWKDIKNPIENPNIESKHIRWILALTSIFTLIFPGLTSLFGLIFKMTISISKNILFFLPSIFPIVFFFMSVRYGLVQFKVPIYGWLIRFTYFLFFFLSYWFILGFHIVQIPYYTEKIWIHIFPALAFLFIMDPLKTIFSFSINRYLVNHRVILQEYLFQSSKNINNPRKIMPFIENITNTTKEGIKASWVKILFCKDEFANWHIENQNVLFLESQDRLWSQLQFWKKTSQPYSAFTQTIGGSIKKSLQKLDGFAIIPFKKFRIAIMISKKSNKAAYLYEDINFLKNILKEAELLLENYKFLIANIQLEKYEKEVKLASLIQKKLIPIHFKEKSFEYLGFSKASYSVTGDYIDLIKQKKDKYFIFLGDVSGHGLGSAYLMTIARTLIHGSALIGKSDLKEIFRKLNEFLSYHYFGYEFMTLFGIYLSIKKIKKLKVATLDFINAGQHSALIYLKKTKQIKEISSFQKLLGVKSVDYRLDKWQIEESFRLFLYSDGAFEIFDKKGKMLGQSQLIEWIQESINMKIQKQLNFLKKNIYERIQVKKESDDISFVITDINL